MRVVGLLPVTVAVILLTGCGSSSTQSSGTASSTASPGAAASQPCGGASAAGGVTAATSSYVMTVATGPVEVMYSQAQVNAQHPTSGELMLSGEMAMQPTASAGDGMSMSSTGTGAMNHPGYGTSASGSSSASANVRHLEVHICTTSGSVVTDANPTIRVVDATLAGSAAVEVPVAVMQGVTAGPSDLHYGNNVMLTPGHSYTVVVELLGQKATFQLPPS